MIRIPIRGSRTLAALGALAWVALTAQAVAEPTATDRAVARTLFEQGRALMTEGKYAEACPKLAESQRLDPAGGTLLNVAACHEKEGKTASAWSEFNDALTQARRDGRADREAAAKERLAVLEPILSRITLRLGAGAAVSGLEVKLDGAVIGQAALGIALPVDPGSHRVAVSAPGKNPWTTQVELAAKADNKDVQIPTLQDAPVPLATSTVPTASVAASSAQPPPAAPSRTLGYVVGGVGIVALGVGGIFGLRAFSKWSDSKSHCPNDACDAEAVSLHDSANNAAWASDILMGVGVVGVGVGTYLVLTSGMHADSAPTAASPAVRVLPAVGTNGGGVSGGGTW